MKFVVLPGLDGTGELHTEFLSEFGGGDEAVVFAYPTELCRYEELLDWVLDRLPKEEFVLVAESFSGPLAAMIADRDLPLHVGTVFVASFVNRPYPLPAFLTNIMRFLPANGKLAARLFQPLVMGSWANPEFTHNFSKSLRRVPVRTLADRLSSVFHRVDRGYQIKNLKSSLYIRATKDRLIPKKVSEQFRRVGVSVLDINGPHFLLQALPKETANLIKGSVSLQNRG